MTLFGDTIAVRGGCISIASMILAAAIFGITDRNVRTSMLRLANEGWLQSSRRGRYSDYALSNSSRQRFGEANERIYTIDGNPDNNSWVLLLPGLLNKYDFRRLRRQLQWSGFAAAGSGILIKPGVNGGLLEELKVADKVVKFTAVGEQLAPMTQLVAASWDLTNINRHYQMFEKIIAQARKTPPARLSPVDAFVIRTLIIHEYRRVLLHDPLLPPALLPKNWRGMRARMACAQLYKELTVAADQFIENNLYVGLQPLPSPANFYYDRFGGLPKE